MPVHPALIQAGATLASIGLRKLLSPRLPDAPNTRMLLSPALLRERQAQTQDLQHILEQFRASQAAAGAGSLGSASQLQTIFRQAGDARARIDARAAEILRRAAERQMDTQFLINFQEAQRKRDEIDEALGVGLGALGEILLGFDKGDEQ